jgi:hypothetical protein
MENGQGMNKLVIKLNPIDSKIIVIASFPERAFLLILQIATAISKIKYIIKLNGRGTNTLNKPRRWEGLDEQEANGPSTSRLLRSSVLEVEIRYSYYLNMRFAYPTNTYYAISLFSANSYTQDVIRLFFRQILPRSLLLPF